MGFDRYMHATWCAGPVTHDGRCHVAYCTFVDRRHRGLCDTIQHAPVMSGDVAVVGSRVKHYAQRFTGCATATVVGFSIADKPTRSAWVSVHVEHDSAVSAEQYPSPWDWDRTELAPDI
jgi:hypothetical protein